MLLPAQFTSMSAALARCRALNKRHERLPGMALRYHVRRALKDSDELDTMPLSFERKSLVRWRIDDTAVRITPLARERL